jgi:hypothetical protein
MNGGLGAEEHGRDVPPALIAAFLSRFPVCRGGPSLPVLGLSVETIEEAFSRHVVAMKAIRSGYSGFVFSTGIAR